MKFKPDSNGVSKTTSGFDYMHEYLAKLEALCIEHRTNKENKNIPMVLLPVEAMNLNLTLAFIKERITAMQETVQEMRTNGETIYPAETARQKSLVKEKGSVTVHGEWLWDLHGMEEVPGDGDNENGITEQEQSDIDEIEKEFDPYVNKE